MESRRLGRTDLQVSAICLGTMTWGRQNTEAEGHAQMDYALERGVTFWDTAEMYAIPPTAETYGTTETIIGKWLASRGGRDRIVLASKAIGRAPGGFQWIREGKARLDRENLCAPSRTACVGCRPTTSTCISSTGPTVPRRASVSGGS
jgi:aryl-alcohol dehydrogenase-like predicted oxidoreductase